MSTIVTNQLNVNIYIILGDNLRLRTRLDMAHEKKHFYRNYVRMRLKLDTCAVLNPFDRKVCHRRFATVLLCSIRAVKILYFTYDRQRLTVRTERSDS